MRKHLNFLYFCSIATILIFLLNSCKTSKSILDNSSWVKLTITEEDCKELGVPTCAFSVLIPPNYEYIYKPKAGAILMIYEKGTPEPVIYNSIVLATFLSDTEYTLAQEKKWFEELKTDPNRKGRSFVNISMIKGIKILNKRRSGMLTEFIKTADAPPNLPNISSVGITYIAEDRKSGVIISLTKESLDKKNIYPDEERAIINSIKFE